MTDFYSVLRKAVDGLADNNAPARKALYARAEAALIAQLKGSGAAPSEQQVAQVRQSLQEASQRIEGEEAVKTAVAPPAAPSGAPGATPASASTAGAATSSVQPYVSPLRARIGQPGAAGNLPPATPPQQPFAVPTTTTPAAPAPTAPPAAPAAPPAAPPAHPMSPAPMSPAPAPMAPSAQPAAPVPDVAVAPEVPQPGGFAPPPPPPPPPSGLPPGTTSGPDADAAGMAGQGFVQNPGEAIDPMQPQMPPQMPPVAEPGQFQSAPSPHDWPEGTAYVPEPPKRRWGTLITLAVLIGLIGIGIWQREVVLRVIEPIVAIVNPGGQDADKNDARLPTQGGTESPQPAVPGAETAQPSAPAPSVIEALLTEESGQEGVAPTQLNGSVNWSLRQQDGTPFIEGIVQIPERGLSLTLNIFKNNDPDFPATHTIDFFFQNAPNATGERIDNVPGLLVKETPRATGSPLAGEVVKVDDGVFLMALHARNTDAATNRARLSRLPFFDVPIIYASGKRGIITLAKGTEGETIFGQAFEAWGE